MANISTDDSEFNPEHFDAEVLESEPVWLQLEYLDGWQVWSDRVADEAQFIAIYAIRGAPKYLGVATEYSGSAVTTHDYKEFIAAEAQYQDLFDTLKHQTDMLGIASAYSAQAELLVVKTGTKINGADVLTWGIRIWGVAYS